MDGLPATASAERTDEELMEEVQYHPELKLAVCLEPAIMQETHARLLALVGGEDGLRDLLEGERSFLLRHMHDPHDADDVLQEVSLKLLRKSDQLHEPENLHGWLRKITYRTMIEHTRHRGFSHGKSLKIMLFTENFDPAAPVGEAQNEHVDATSAIAVLQTAMKAADFQVLDLLYLQEKSIEEISQELDIPEGTVKRRLHVARQRAFDILSHKPSRRSA
ncbi:RNA polymerase sigma factor [Candidatus Peregrinibacteria bacterium]|nr:RNA polymerase sigma factor [Candidatus Peregrinibacteria bacterium]